MIRHPFAATRAVVLVVLLVSGGTPLVTTAAPDGQPVGARAALQDAPADRPWRVPPGGQRGVDSRGAAPAATVRSTGTRPRLQPSAAGPQVNVSYTYRRLPEHRGVVGVTMRLPATAGLDPVRFTFDEAFTVTETANLTRTGAAYTWTGETAATVVYRVPVGFSYTGTVGETWTLVEHRGPSTTADAAVTFHPTISVTGEGYVGNRTVLLGAHDVYTRTAAGEQLRLVVPEGVSLLYGPTRTVEALAAASRALRIGGRAAVVHAFATPEIETEASFLVQPGFALSRDTLLVDADSDLDVWTHEYVHTRQAFSDTERLRWLTEATAEYYGWLLSIRQGYDGWTALQGVFGGARDDDSVLAAPESWNAESDYRKGALVLAVLDREIRAATDGERTLQDVLRRVNAAGQQATLARLLDAVRAVGGPAVAATADRYITTAATPAYDPGRDELTASYGYASPQVETRVTAVAAAGPNYTRPLTPSGVVRIGRPETLRITTRVRNTGDATGIVAVAPRVTEREAALARVDRPWVGPVGPGETVTRTAAHRFDDPGTYEVGSAPSFRVLVVPARDTASVTDVTVNRSRTTETRVVADITVRNTGDQRMFAEYPVVLAGRQTTTVALVIDAHSARTVTRAVGTVDGPSAPLTVGGAETTIQRRTGTTSTPTSTSTARGRPVATVGGLLGVFVLLGLVVVWLSAGRE
jgi:hypothetical protein